MFLTMVEALGWVVFKEGSEGWGVRYGWIGGRRAEGKGEYRF